MFQPASSCLIVVEMTCLCLNVTCPCDDDDGIVAVVGDDDGDDELAPFEIGSGVDASLCLLLVG